MRMKVICGDPDCREEFFVESKDRVWICPNCTREIENRNYPFLTAKLMQARIDRESADWKVRLEELIGEARKEIGDRSKEGEYDLAFLDEFQSKLEEELSNSEYRDLHDNLLQRSREKVIQLEK